MLRRRYEAQPHVSTSVRLSVEMNTALRAAVARGEARSISEFIEIVLDKHFRSEVAPQ
jgi:Arc/MetJ-type ribon-helix-helix transcriptional regulator